MREVRPDWLHVLAYLLTRCGQARLAARRGGCGAPHSARLVERLLEGGTRACRCLGQDAGLILVQIIVALGDANITGGGRCNISAGLVRLARGRAWLLLAAGKCKDKNEYQRVTKKAGEVT